MSGAICINIVHEVISKQPKNTGLPRGSWFGGKPAGQKPKFEFLVDSRQRVARNLLSKLQTVSNSLGATGILLAIFKLYYINFVKTSRIKMDQNLVVSDTETFSEANKKPLLLELQCSWKGSRWLNQDFAIRDEGIWKKGSILWFFLQRRLRHWILRKFFGNIYRYSKKWKLYLKIVIWISKSYRF